ncbi:MAG TPA: aminoglycoside adenylyltransferase domain-containing protein [Verrucomicrobiae bacterium]|jgi:hypothetical protein|nr:aminoglycoside adenylyltransferase domain-containing protein [Verrucomicrobiae bacterium]
MYEATPFAVTPYKEINNLITAWVEGLRRCLADNVIGLYLGGSLSYGDFVPQRSDIDLQAVVRVPLIKDELSRVERLHKEIEEHFAGWARRIECSYVPLQLMGELKPPATPRPWWGFGVLYADAPAGNEWVINHYLLSNYGIALYGPPFQELVPAIPVEEVRRASTRDLFAEWAPKIKDPAWLSDSHQQSYLVLNLCRILCTCIGGEARSKKVACAWTKEKCPEWKDLIEAAERWSYGSEMKRQDDVIAFIRFAVRRVREMRSP